MFWFFVFIVLMIAGVSLILTSKIGQGEDTISVRPGGFVALAVGVLILVLSMVKVVPANTVGIPVTLGKPGSPWQSGLHVKAPWTNVEEFSTRVQTSNRLSSEDEGDKERRDCVQVKASDGSAECVDITIRYTIDPKKAGSLYKRYGDFRNVNDVLIRRVTNDTAATTFNRLTPEQTIAGGITENNAAEGQNPLDLRSTFRDAMKNALDSFGVRLDSTSVGNVDFDNPEVQERIDEKIAARQQAETAKITQQKAVTEAETAKKVAATKAEEAVIAAQGEADANRIRSEALTPQVLLEEYYQALAKVGTIITDGSTPVILQPATSPTTAKADG